MMRKYTEKDFWKIMVQRENVTLEDNSKIDKFNDFLGFADDLETAYHIAYLYIVDKYTNTPDKFVSVVTFFKHQIVLPDGIIIIEK